MADLNHAGQLTRFPRSFDEIRVDRPAPAHVPRDRLVDVTFALGGVPNDEIDPYEPMGWLGGEDVPRLIYHVTDPDAPRSEVEGVGGIDAGGWIVTRYEDIDRLYTDGEHFSTRHRGEFQRLIGETFHNIPAAIDAPDHRKYRMFLTPFFAPSRLNRMEVEIREMIGSLIDEFAGKGEVDMAEDFARVFPVRIFLTMAGLPLSMRDQFLAWGKQLIHGGTIDNTVAAMRAILAYLRTVIAEKEAAPDESLISAIANGEINGEPLTGDEKIGMVWFLWIAGLNTVAATIIQMFRRMALQPEIQDQIGGRPELYQTAVEEFLRTQPLFSIGRTATRDFEWHGVQIKAGETVMGMNGTANFEPGRFVDPRRFDPARSPNRHLTFISGIHLCMGAPLARRELRILLDEWFKRIPRFRLKPGADTTIYPAPLSMRNLPLQWDAP